MNIPAEFWIVVDHEAWDEAVILHAADPQAAEDAAEAFILSATAEYRTEGKTDAEWLAELYETGHWTIRPASFKS